MLAAQGWFLDDEKRKLIFVFILKRGPVGPRGSQGPPGISGVPGVDGIDVSLLFCFHSIPSSKLSDFTVRRYNVHLNNIPPFFSVYS